MRTRLLESWPGDNVGETATCEKPFRGERRFVRGNVSGRDASYEEALYGRSRFACPPSISEPPLMLINGEFGTVVCAFECFLYIYRFRCLCALRFFFLKISAFHSGRMKFAEDGFSTFGCLRWDSSDAFGSAFLNFFVWELCFSLVSPLWE